MINMLMTRLLTDCPAALMEDAVSGLRARGVPCNFLSSSQKPDVKKDIRERWARLEWHITALS